MTMKLTRSQFGAATHADEKWIENTARILRLRLTYSADQARWMGLVCLLAQQLKVPLLRAATLADELGGHAPDARSVSIGETDGPIAIVVDLARYHSTFAASLSAAIHHGGPRRRGRPAKTPRPRGRKAIANAASYGVDLTLVRESMARKPAERLAQLDANASFLRGLKRV